MSFQHLESGRGVGSRRRHVNGKQDPTQVVASGIFQINTAVSTFQRFVNTLGTPKDTPEHREKLHKTRLHIGQLVKDTSAKLKQASETDHSIEVSVSKKIADAKLAKDFQAVLKEFQKAQRLAAARETAYTPFVPHAVLPSYSAGDVDITDKSPEQQALLVESRRQEVLLLDNEIAFSEAIVEETEQGIQEIQQQIGEVNEIFKDLALLVHEQGTMIDDIGSHIDGAQAATGEGKSQLVKAAKTQRSNSSLVSCGQTNQSRSDVQMERVRLFQVQTNSMIRFVLSFLITIGPAVYASSYGQTDYMDKYIAKNYFEKHDRLIQQEFDNFIANEIPLGLSQVITDKNYVKPTLSDLHRAVNGEGSHRRLSSSIRIKLPHKLKTELNTHSCEVIIIERLPSGVFADPFELQHLVQRGVFSDAAVFGDANLELPSFRSNQSVVEIHMSMASKVLSRYVDDSEVNLDLPLHARYPPLGHGFSRVEFGQPDLFICCSLDENVSERGCIIIPVNHMGDNKANTVVWEIPCGIKEHAGVVSAVTFGFTIVAAMLIILTSICNSDSKGSNKLKCS